MKEMEEKRVCPGCQKTLALHLPLGLCPDCLIKSGFNTGTDPGRPGMQAGFVPPTIDEVARLFPQLEILELLGAGGMGAVYKGRQPALDRFVALKILPATNTSGINFAERFNREARALARLSHPNIVAVHEFGLAGALHYFIMEFVDGANLRQLERASRLSPREALQIIPQICDALQYAHDEGVVHRDIKPENVLVDRRGRVKIADFGLAKILGRDGESARLTLDGQVMGTPHYMAPEQVERPLTVDHRADIFSLGVVFYEMLTGELPLGKFPPPSRKVEVDVRLDEVVLRALEKEPDLRYQHASQVKTDLETVSRLPPVRANAVKRRTLAYVALGLILVAAAGTLPFVRTPPDVARPQHLNGVDSLPPVVVMTEPVSGSRGVEPGTREIRVTFSKVMTPRSWSWSTAWSNSTPEFVEGTRYEPDQRTCVIKARLDPGRTYAFWLNSDNFHNFKDAQGHPAVPYLLIFETKQK